MKRIFLLAVLGLATATTLPVSAANFGSNKTTKDDTVLVKLANGAKMSLIVKNTEQLRSFQNYSLDSLMVMLNTYIAEAEKMEKKDVTGKDYTVNFRPAEEGNDKGKPEKITITFESSKGDTIKNTIKKGVFINVDYKEGGKTKTVKIGSNPNMNCDSVSTTSVSTTPKKKKRYDDGLNIDLGFNTFLNTNGNMLDVVGLKTWGSRFVSLNPFYKIRIGKEKSPFY